MRYGAIDLKLKLSHLVLSRLKLCSLPFSGILIVNSDQTTQTMFNVKTLIDICLSLKKILIRLYWSFN